MTQPAKDFAAVLAELREFIAVRHWEKFHSPKNLTMALAAEVGELCQILRWADGDAALTDAARDAAIGELSQTS